MLKRSIDYSILYFSLISCAINSAVPMCPYGCGERRIRHADLDDLMEMLEEAEEDVRQSNRNLNLAKKRVNNTFETFRKEPGKERDSENEARNSLDFHDGSSEAMEDEVCSYFEEAGDVLSQKPSEEGLRRNRLARQWEKVQAIVVKNQSLGSRSISKPRIIETGQWRFPFCNSLGNNLVQHGQSFVEVNKRVLQRAASESGRVMRTVVAESTYAVVTFTSRQAAIAARQCIADGSGLDRWTAVEEIPIPPLADAAPFNFWSCRGLCRPVTLTISDSQKIIRRNM